MPSVMENKLCKVRTRFPLESRLYMYTEQLPFSGVHEYSTIPTGRDNPGADTGGGGGGGGGGGVWGLQPPLLSKFLFFCTQF